MEKPLTSYECSSRGCGMDQDSCHNKFGYDIGRCSHMIKENRCWRGITQWDDLLTK